MYMYILICFADRTINEDVDENEEEDVGADMYRLGTA